LGTGFPNGEHTVTQEEICAKLNSLTQREWFLVSHGGGLPERLLDHGPPLTTS
jgi:hypothetical protein